MKSGFCESIEISSYNETYLQLLMLKYYKGKLFMTIRSSFFVLISYQILTSTNEYWYLRLLVLNNGTNKIIYDYYKLIFVLKNYTLIISFQTTLQL